MDHKVDLKKTRKWILPVRERFNWDVLGQLLSRAPPPPTDCHLAHRLQHAINTRRTDLQELGANSACQLQMAMLFHRLHQFRDGGL